MEQETKKEWKERINYVKNPIDDRGIQVLTGKSVNYPQVTISADTEEELLQDTIVAIKEWLKYSSKVMDREDPIELKEVEGPAEWLHQPNIDYWEIERIKHLLRSRVTMRTWLKKIIVNNIEKEAANIKLDSDAEYRQYRNLISVIGDKTASNIIEAIINYENDK